MDSTINIKVNLGYYVCIWWFKQRTSKSHKTNGQFLTPEPLAQYMLREELPMKKLKINRTDFDLAFEISDFESSAYLDTNTGAVVIIEDYALTELKKHVAEDDDLSAIVQKINSDDMLDESVCDADCCS